MQHHRRSRNYCLIKKQKKGISLPTCLCAQQEERVHFDHSRDRKSIDRQDRQRERERESEGRHTKCVHSQGTAMELYYSAIENAVESWKIIQTDIPNYEEVVGRLLFEQ